MKILNTIGDAFSSDAKKILDGYGDVTYSRLSRTELMENIVTYEIMVVGLEHRFDSELIDKALKLQVIATATTGTDHIDIKYASKKGIAVVSLKDDLKFLETLTGTAELAFGLLLQLFRTITHAHTSVLNGNWNREAFKGNTIKDKILGIIGFGRLGKMMAQYGKAFGMRVIAYDPFIEDAIFQQYWVTNVTFEELLRQSDVISIHVHLTDDTRQIFNASSFKKMKNSAYLINTSRGGIVDEADLIDALEQTEIAGYAADVLDGEIYFEQKGTLGHPLVQYAKNNRNVIITPHIGGMTEESRRNTDIRISERLGIYLSAITANNGY